MRNFLLLLILVIIGSGENTIGQSFDWNTRGGLNLMKSHKEGKDVAVLYHLGIQAGMRIASFGIYGEALYSMQENLYGGNPISYFIPSLLVKGYWQELLFVEMGGSYLSKTGESGVQDDIRNPDDTIRPMAGLGVKFSKVELSLRTILKQSGSYGLIQITLALKF
jgi:hypothetical protein